MFYVSCDMLYNSYYIMQILFLYDTSYNIYYIPYYLYNLLLDI